MLFERYRNNKVSKDESIDEKLALILEYLSYRPNVSTSAEKYYKDEVVEIHMYYPVTFPRTTKPHYSVMYADDVTVTLYSTNSNPQFKDNKVKNYIENILYPRALELQKYRQAKDEQIKEAQNLFSKIRYLYNYEDEYLTVNIKYNKNDDRFGNIVNWSRITVKLHNGIVVFQADDRNGSNPLNVEIYKKGYWQEYILNIADKYDEIITNETYKTIERIKKETAIENEKKDIENRFGPIDDKVVFIRTKKKS